MSAENQGYAGNFAVGGCLNILSLSLAMAAALYLVEGALYSSIVFLIVAGLVGLVGC